MAVETDDQTEKRELPLASGGTVSVLSDSGDEVLEVADPKGEVVLRVRLTEAGPVLSLEGVRLELRAAEAISLKAPLVEIDAGKQAVVRSDGGLEVSSAAEMRIDANGDMRLQAPMIYIN